MDPKSLTDDIIKTLLAAPKRIKSRRARETVKAKHTERNFNVESLDGEHVFTVFVRQSTKIANNFSCGLIWHASSSQQVILTRYNGSDHVHGNPIEGTEFGFACHIHIATERYIMAGKKAELFASETDRYRTVDEALQCLLQDCNIEGWSPSWSRDVPETPSPQWDLFK